MSRDQLRSLALAAGLALFGTATGVRAQESGVQPVAEPQTPEPEAAVAQAQEPKPAEPKKEEPKPAEPKVEKPKFLFRLDPAVLDYRLTDDQDETSAKFEEYREFYSGFGIPKLRLTGESEDHNRSLDVTLRNVARNDAYYSLDYDVSGRYSLRVENNQIPHRFGNQGTLLFAFTDKGVLELSDSTQAQLQGAVEEQFAQNRSGVNFEFLQGLIQPYIDAGTRIDLALQRDRTRIRADIAKMKRWSFAAEVFHEDRTGTRPYGASFGFNNVTEVPEPIDYDTVHVKVGAEWTSKKAGVQLGVRHSRFVNHIDSLTYDNPWRAVDSTDGAAYLAPSSSSINGSSRARAALAPDNDSNELYATAHARIGDKSWVSGSFNFIAMRQDDRLFPFTINSALDETGGAPFDATDPTNLPVSQADTQVDVLNFAVAAGTRVAGNLDLKAQLRRYDYDNKSDRIEIPGYARFDAVWEEIGRITVPYAYARLDAGLEATYNFGHGTTASAGYTFQRWDRDFREIDSSDENIFRLRFNTRAVRNLWIRASYKRGDRSIDEYDVAAQEESFTDPEGPNNLPTLRKFDEAGRVYNDYQLQLQWTPNSKVGVTAGLGGRTEEYQDEDGNVVEHGLRSDDILRFNAEISYTPKEGTTLFVFGDHADREVFQRSRQSGSTPSTNPADDWEVTFNELTDTLGAGLSFAWGQGWTFDASAAYSRSDGEADFFSPPGGSPNEAVGFDNYEDTTLTAITAKLGYQITKTADVTLLYRLEDYSIDSFIIQGLNEYLPGALLLNADNADYNVSVYAARLGFRF
jgi:MtrB/PioB family decaheme-associated outer membrane protein